MLFRSVTNIDDHLRNHGFILTSSGWRLSPLFDVNPNPFGDHLSLNVTENDNSIDLSLAIAISEYFGLTRGEAQETAADICDAVKNNWAITAEKYELSRGAVEYMRPAFIFL